MIKGYMTLGWIKLSKLYALTDVTEKSVKHKMSSAAYPEWRLGCGMFKKLRDGIYVNYERFQEWVNNQPDSAA